MTIIEQIKTEIERRKGYISVTHFAEDLLSFLSTLESEKPMQEELENEISKSIENLEGCTTKIDDNPEYHLINDEDLREFARHFAQWGAEHAREQIMKDAIDTTVHLEPGANPVIEIGVSKFGLKVKDKVRVTIVKED